MGQSGKKQYCDTKKLEEVWFNWLVAKNTPQLDVFRNDGMLWTKAIGYVQVDGEVLLKGKRTFWSPTHPIRLHCILSSSPIFFLSYDGNPSTYGASYQQATGKASPILMFDLQVDPQKFDKEAEKYLLANGFIKEEPTNDYWGKLLESIYSICQGVSVKFRQKTEEDANDLASEALSQVVNKLVRDRLVYTPGRAPVFNLLTTTIHRIMFSIMNKRKNQRERINKLLRDANSGQLPNTNRSLRLHTDYKKMKT